MTSACVFHSLPLAHKPEHPAGKLFGSADAVEEAAQHLRRRAVEEPERERAIGAGLGLDTDLRAVGRPEVEPDAARRVDVEAPAVAADDVRERHGQVGLPLGALALVLLEDDGVEFGAACGRGCRTARRIR